MKKNLLVLEFLLIIGGIIAVLVLIRGPLLIQKKASSYNTQLNFVPATINATVGQQVEVGVYIYISSNTQVPIVGADVVFNYNTNQLRLDSVIPDNTTKSNTALKSFAPIVSETDCNFDETRVLQGTGTVSSRRTIEFGVAAFNCSNPPVPPATPPPYNLNSTPVKLATLRFTPLTVPSGGKAYVYFAPQQVSSSTVSNTDSNIVQAGVDLPLDILDSVNTLTINVSGGTGPTSTPTPTRTPTPSWTPTPTRTPTPTQIPTPTITPTLVPGCTCNANKCSSGCSTYSTSNFACTSNAHCARSKRINGDADGNGVVNFVDYDYYRRTVLFDSGIPAEVNADFNGDGEIGTVDGRIVLCTLNVGCPAPQ